MKNNDISRSINIHLFNSGIDIPEKNFYFAGSGDNKPCVITKYISSKHTTGPGAKVRYRSFRLTIADDKSGTRESISEFIDTTREKIISAFGRKIQLYNFINDNPVLYPDTVSIEIENDQDKEDQEKSIISFKVKY